MKLKGIIGKALDVIIRNETIFEVRLKNKTALQIRVRN